jgi:L-amino acid N-acyltransferase YncA
MISSMREHLVAAHGLTLRPWRSEDRDAVLAAFAPEVMSRQAAHPIRTAADAGKWIEQRARQWADGHAYAWAVLAPGGAPVANVAVGAFDPVHQTGWFSYWTDAAQHGRGYASAAARAVAAWAFADLGLFRLELGHRLDNPASCAVALRAGFAVEGRQRGALNYDGVRHDVETHARLATDPPPPVEDSAAARDFTVEPMRADDAEAVLAIYRQGIDTGDATFETAPPDWAAFDAARLPDHRFVARARADGRILGWVACSPTSTRAAYAGVVEHSVYVAPEARGRGVGRVLLDALLASTEAAGIWTVQSGVFPENTASLALHRAAGFRIVGVRSLIGHTDGRFRDVVLIERRAAGQSLAPAAGSPAYSAVGRADGR